MASLDELKLNLLITTVHDATQQMIVNGLNSNISKDENESDGLQEEMSSLEGEEKELITKMMQIYQQKLAIRKQQRSQLSQKYNDQQLNQYQTNKVIPFTDQLFIDMNKLQNTLKQGIENTSIKVENESKTESDDTQPNTIDINNEDEIFQLLTTTTTTITTTTDTTTTGMQNCKLHSHYIPPKIVDQLLSFISLL